MKRTHTYLTRADAYPEHLDWPDTGCSVAPRCLECPLPVCKYDVGGRADLLINLERDRRIMREIRKGRTVGQVARAYGLSKRSIFRIKERWAA